MRNAKKNPMNITLTIGIIAVFSMVALYFYELLCPSFLTVKLGVNGDSAARIRNLMDGVVSTFIIAAFVYWFRDSIVAYFVKKEATIIHYFSDLESCLRYLAEGISYFEKDIKNAHITTVTPLVFSDGYIRYYCSEDKEKYNKCLKYFDEYNRIYRRVIDGGGRGSYDRTIFGKTGIENIDSKTKSFVFDNYFSGEFPDTSELGFHDNLNEFSVFVFSESMGESNPSVSKRGKFAMQIHYSSNFKEIYGFICQSDEAVNRILAFVDFKFDDVENSGNLFVRNDGTSQYINGSHLEFRKKIDEFYG